MKNMIKKGNQVEILTGKDKGKKGEVIELLRQQDRISVPAKLSKVLLAHILCRFTGSFKLITWCPFRPLARVR